MASLIEMPATNPASLTSVPAPHTVEEENCHKLPSLTSERAPTCACTHARNMLIHHSICGVYSLMPRM